MTACTPCCFLLREVAVFAETEPGRKECIPGKKALINDDTRRVLSVVSDQYQVLHNGTALKLARKCCTAAFPNTAPASWEVFSVETPKTGGHCRIDFKHDGKVPGYDWSFSEAEQDTYGPFIRVTNSYNRTCVFGLRFGLVRWACTNGWIDWHSSITIAVAHDVKEMEASIEAKISEAKFRKVHAEFRGLIGPLRRAEVQRCRFRPIMQSVLQIRRPQACRQNVIARGSPWNRTRWCCQQVRRGIWGNRVCFDERNIRRCYASTDGNRRLQLHSQGPGRPAALGWRLVGEIQQDRPPAGDARGLPGESFRRRHYNSLATADGPDGALRRHGVVLPRATAPCR